MDVLRIYVEIERGTDRAQSRKNSVLTSFICALLHSRLNSAKSVTNRFLFKYMFINNIFVPNSMFSKQYRQSIVEKKINSHFFHVCTSALPPKQCKTSKNLYLFNYIFTNNIIVPNSMFSKGTGRVQQRKIQCSFHSFVHSCTPA